MEIFFWENYLRIKKCGNGDEDEKIEEEQLFKERVHR